MKLSELKVCIRLTNARAAKALAVASRIMAEYADQHPYDEDLGLAKKALEYAVKNLTAEVEK